MAEVQRWAEWCHVLLRQACSPVAAGGVYPRVRRQEPSPSDSRGLWVPDLTRFQPPGALLGGSHTLRIRGAGAWKMAEALGVNVFLTSGT